MSLLGIHRHFRLPALAASSAAVPTLLAAYVAFAFAFGPRLMSGRKPLRLKPLVALYNAVQVVLNVAALMAALRIWLDPRVDVLCPAVHGTPADKEEYAAQVTQYYHYYMMLKVLDMADTVFFVLGKKKQHVSFLHVYHHASMVASIWLVLRIDPGGGSALFAGFVNNIIHCFLYAYYLLCILELKIVRQWKKYLTMLQIVQFVIVGLYTLHLLMPCCDVKWSMGLLQVWQSSFFFYLFINFYRRSYGHSRSNANGDKAAAHKN